MEALTLVQTGKTRRMPIILVGSDFWRGMLCWLQQVLISEGMIAPEDMDLMQVIDEPARWWTQYSSIMKPAGLNPQRRNGRSNSIYNKGDISDKMGY